MNTLFKCSLPDDAETRRFRARGRLDLRGAIATSASSSFERASMPVPAEERTPECLHHFVEQQVERTPNATAVIFEDRTLTFAQLNSAANHWAQRLQALRVGPEVRVGIAVPRSLEMLVGLLAILKAGGVYVPMDPAYPRDRLAFMMEDAQVPVLLTSSAICEALPPGPATVLCLDESPVSDLPSAVANPVSAVTGEHLAYVIYTSGSTGKPKGVMVRHRNVSNFFKAMDKVLGREPGVWLAVTSISFDISVLEVFWTLARGFKVVLQRELRGAGESIGDQIRRHGVTHFQCTPSQAAMLAEDPGTLTALRGLRKLLLGGEALLLPLAKRLAGAGELLNMYGPTETTVWSTAHRWNPEAASANGIAGNGTATVPIGRPILNTGILILDEARRRVAAGEMGEIYIEGAGVVRGYLNRPELTAERFVAHPFAAPAGERIYRTGDLGRFLPDGTIEFLGRVDHQVKLRGFRIELGEIEAVLCRHPAVREAVVSVWEAAPGDQRLVGYVVPRNGTPVERNELRALCRKELPEHMVPAAWVELSALPLTPNGKTNRQALPKPDPGAFGAAAVFVAAETGLEQAIAGIWRELLRVDRVGLHDNFFDLGGHSVLLAQVQFKLREGLGREVPLLELFQYPTVSALARRLEGGAQEKPAFEKVRQRATRQRMLFHALAGGRFDIGTRRGGVT